MPQVAIIINILPDEDSSNSCMEECQRQMDSVAAEGKYTFSFSLNDKGEDGLQSSWAKASRDGADFFLWIDHDLSLSEGMISCLLENSEFLRHKAVITGTVARPDGSLLFGGRARRGRLVDPDPTIPIPCLTYDMSVLLVPEYVFARLENPSDFFRRSLISLGFGSRVRKAGVARMVAPGILAVTKRKAEIPAWKDPESTLKEKLAWFFRSLFK